MLAGKSALVTGSTSGIGLGIAQALAADGADLNAVCPGYVLTPLVEKQIPATAHARGITEDQVRRDVLPVSQPTKKFVTVEEVAGLTKFLCTTTAASITGAVLPVEGGWTAH